MAKKSKFKIKFDSPVIIIFSLICLLIMALDTFVTKGYLTTNIFLCPGNQATGSISAFSLKNPMDYVKLFTHVFGSLGWNSLLVNMIFISLLGVILEERYGSIMIFVMITITSLVSGVLSCVLLPYFTTGCVSIVFMMILLSAITSLSKKQISVSWIIIFFLYLGFALYSRAESFQVKGFLKILESNISTFIDLAAGLCGSLFGFLVRPKSEKEPKVKKEKSTSSTYSSNSSSSSEDTTVIGSIEL